MGFTVYYEVTEPVSEQLASQIDDRTEELCDGRSWLSCEPVFFFRAANGGTLTGGSKPNFYPENDEAEEAKSSGLPDGTLADVIAILQQLSIEFQIDWNFSHDHDPGPIGTIRNGEADRSLLTFIESFGEAKDFLKGTIGSQPGFDSRFDQIEDPQDDDDNDDYPRILKFPGT